MDTKYELIKLKNGIKILYIPFPKSKLMYIEIKLLTGTINETASTLEYGHILEHMNAQFTSSKYPDAKENERKVNMYGGYTNASTYSYFTKYYIKGPIKYSKYFIDLIINSYINFKLDKTIFETEKKAVVEELNSDKNSIWNTLSEHIDKVLYKNHPYAKTLDESIKNTKLSTIKNILNYRKKNYKTSNTIIIIAGDIKKSEVIKPLLFMKKTIYKVKLPGYKYKIQNPLVFINTNTNSTKIFLIFNMMPYTYFTMQADHVILLKTILTDGLSSRLYSLRMKHGLIYSISSTCKFDYYNKELNSFTIETETNSRNIPKVINIILSELNSLKRNLISDNEFNTLKNNILTQKLEQKRNNNMEDYVNRYSSTVLFGKKIQTYSDYFNQLNKISRNKIKNLSNTIFNTKKLVIGYGGKVNHNNEIKQILLKW